MASSSVMNLIKVLVLLTAITTAICITFYGFSTTGQFAPLSPPDLYYWAVSAALSVMWLGDWLLYHKRMAEQKQNLNPHQKQSANGVIEWKVTGDLLQQFKDAKHKQEFYSPQFTTRDGTSWRIQFYPRGSRGTVSPDYCDIYLECVKLSGNKTQIGVNWSFNISEVDWVSDTADTFKKDGQANGKSKAFKAERINNLYAMNVKCFVEETMDVSDANTYFEWKVNNYWMQKWKNAKYKKAFFSPKFNAIGGEWYFAIYPNGNATEGIAFIELYCASIECKEKELNVSYYVDSVSLEYSQTNCSG
eukprot:338604_1